jgi:hypothetical protein
MLYDSWRVSLYLGSSLMNFQTDSAVLLLLNNTLHALKLPLQYPSAGYPLPNYNTYINVGFSKSVMSSNECS